MDKIHLLCSALLPFLMLCCVATSFSDEPVVLAFESNVTFHIDFPSDNCSTGITAMNFYRRRVTALNLPAEEIELKSKGIAGNAERASGIIPGRRLLVSLNRQEDHCKNCHDMDRAEGVATPITKGEEAINAQEYREPVKPGHSSNPDHSDRGKNTGKPPL